MNMFQVFKIGDEIGGYCNGYFGRYDYENKICVLVTSKYAVFQYGDGRGTILNYEESLANDVGDDWVTQ